MKKLLLLLLLSPVLSQSQIITTFAGNGTLGFSGDGFAATMAELYSASGLCIDGHGNVYISDELNNRVRKVNAAGIISTVAGNGSTAYTGDGGPATAAGFNFTSAVALDTGGNLYIADSYHNCVRIVNPAGVINTFAGNGTAGYTGDGGDATAAQLNSPVGLATDKQGNVYIADRGNNSIRQVSASGMITTIAGDGTAGFAGDGGYSYGARFNSPYGLATDTAGNIYIADTYNMRIRKISTPSMVINSIAGGAWPGLGDGGPATAALLNNPTGVALDKFGNLFIGEASGNRVRMVNTTGIISTFAGTGIAGFSGDYGPATAAELFQPWGLAADTSSLYIADFTNNRIRRIGLCIAPSVAAIAGPKSVCLEIPDTLTDATPGGIWASSNPSIADIGSATGIVNGFTPGIVVISYIVGNSCGTAIALDTITVNPYAGAISGADSLCAGDTATLHNIVTDGVWISTNPSVASISASGTVTGISGGMDTIMYVVVDSCGTDTARFDINLLCATAVPVTEGTKGFIAIFPNPAINSVTITSPAKISKLTITNPLGQTLYTHEYSTSKAEVNIANLPPGVYLIKINDNEVRKFVKE